MHFGAMSYPDLEGDELNEFLNFCSEMEAENDWVEDEAINLFMDLAPRDQKKIIQGNTIKKTQRFTKAKRFLKKHLKRK